MDGRTVSAIVRKANPGCVSRGRVFRIRSGWIHGSYAKESGRTEYLIRSGINDGIPDTIALIELKFMKLGIQSLSAQELVVFSAFDNFAVLYYKDAVGAADGG